MKARVGFVSNSSSSSFVVACPAELDGKFTVKVEIDLKKYCKYDKVLKTMDDLNDYIEDYYGFEIEEFLTEESEENVKKYNRLKAAIESGMDVYIGWASHNDSYDPVELLIGNGYDLEKNNMTKGVQVIVNPEM
jgi:hypothetical protein